MENNDNKKQRNKQRIGILWSKVSPKNGKKFLAGLIRVPNDFGNLMEFDVIMVPNEYKEKATDPDYVILGESVKLSLRKKTEVKPVDDKPKTDSDNQEKEGKQPLSEVLHTKDEGLDDDLPI